MTSAKEQESGDAWGGSLVAPEQLLRVTNLLCLVLLVLGAQAVALGGWLDMLLVLLAMLTALAGRMLIRCQRVPTAITLVLSVLTVLASISLISNQGLYSGALLSFPGILIVAGILSSRRLFLGLLALMMAVVGLVSALSLAGIMDYVPVPHGVGRLVVVSSLLLICAVAIWVLTNDLRNTQAHLVHEILEVQRSKANLNYLAQHDPLTDLPNRAVIEQRLDYAILRAQGSGKLVALLFLDIDHFKMINDSLGHAAGDQLLQRIARRLKEMLRDDDTVSRQGGDEFLIVIGDVENMSALAAVIKRIQNLIARPFNLNGMELIISASIGVSVCPADGADFGVLLNKAETAMYQAKTAGRNTYCLFRDDMSTDTHERLGIEQDLRQAIARNELELHYQPIVDLLSGTITAVEALLRWRHPERGMVGPDLFISVAEQAGLIVDIGDWVLREACLQTVAWQREGLPAMVVSVNLSAVQLCRGDLEVSVREALNHAGLLPELLDLELTESMLLQDSSSAIRLLNRLKRLGVKLSIDDFGTGYSNLSYLQRFRVDRLKIDKSFVQSIIHNEQDRAIVTAIIQMAHSLKLKTTAEGIEEESSRSLLAELGCDYGQGYLFSRPVPASAIPALARSLGH